MISMAYSALEAALNRTLQLDPDTITRLASLQGKIIRIYLTDWQMDFYLLPQQNGIKLLKEYRDFANTTIRGTSSGLIKAVWAKASGAALFDQAIEVTGDVETGEKIRDILKQLDLDWEEYISHWVGDAIAHQIGWRTRQAIKLGRETFDNLSGHLKDFLQYEGRYLPRRESVENFYRDVAHLRDGVDRAVARMDRIEKLIEGKNSE